MAWASRTGKTSKKAIRSNAMKNKRPHGRSRSDRRIEYKGVLTMVNLLIVGPVNLPNVVSVVSAFLAKAPNQSEHSCCFKRAPEETSQLFISANQSIKHHCDDTKSAQPKSGDDLPTGFYDFSRWHKICIWLSLFQELPRFPPVTLRLSAAFQPNCLIVIFSHYAAVFPSISLSFYFISFIRRVSR